MILPFDYIGYKRLSENKRFRSNCWYSDATWREMGECCPLLYCQEITYLCWWFIQNKMVTLKNLILKYIGMKNILKRKCHVGINVVFIEVIETVWCMIHEKHVNYPMIMFAPSLIWDRHKLFEGGSPITLRWRREKGMYYFFSSTF